MGIQLPNAEAIYESMKTVASVYADENPIHLYLKRYLLAMTLTIDPIITNTMNIKEIQSLANRIASGCDQILVYEDRQQQSLARDVIEYDKIYQYAQEHLAKQRERITSTDHSVKLSYDIAFLYGLLHWFKRDFFTWVNKPRCSNPDCGARPPSMESCGVSEPNAEEKTIGWAGRTEIYRCKECNQITRFPRYNNPSHLLKTRRGRCGEWANAFCLICRSLSLDARYVLDFTDHVWVEVWLPSLQRFVHADCCEKTMDAPLMYESGWNKKLTYILSFSRYGVVDSTSRYSRKYSEVLLRRASDQNGPIIEAKLKDLIQHHDTIMEQRWLASQYVFRSNECKCEHSYTLLLFFKVNDATRLTVCLFNPFSYSHFMIIYGRVNSLS
jgi:hypothetical protein